MSARGCGNHRNTGRHRLYQCSAVPLVHRWREQQITARKKLDRVRAKTGEDDDMAETELVRKNARRPALLIIAANDEKADARSLRVNDGRRAQKNVRTLLLL